MDGHGLDGSASGCLHGYNPRRFPREDSILNRHVIANWKMNIPQDGIENFVRDLRGVRWDDRCRLSIAAPFPFLAEVRDRVRESRLPVRVAAQNVSDHESGAFTGEVSASMLLSSGAELVIAGHSERRTLYGETDELVGRKLRAAQQGGLIPVLCIGEDLETREADRVSDLLDRQLRGALEGYPFSAGSPIIAYEPVWAIGTGQNATSAVIAETAAGIRRAIVSLRPDLDDPPLLYGGSVTEHNARELIREADVDGFLVGGASLEADKLAVIYEAAAERR